METDDAFESAVHRHDAQVAELGLPIWVGSEPTFTDREAQTPAWLHAALGDDKELRARALLGTLSRLMPGALVLRSTGRLYPGEKLPRWNLGLLRRRDGEPLWNGPPDPLLAAEPGPAGPPDIAAFASALAEAFASQHWASECVERRPRRRKKEEDADKEGADDAPAWTVTATADADAEPLQFVLRAYEDKAEPDADRAACAAIELPEIARVELFLAALPCIEHAARACGLPALVLTGATPPVDATLELTTVTPDPAVIEINSAPSRNCAEFLWRSQQVYAAAAAHGLSPYRLYFNGQVADSGGAGQVTFGGPTPEASPFVSNLQLLPRLVRFFNRHPALSYRFAHDFVGGSGQSVRPDERGTGAFDDLVLALALLERETVTEPELLWKSLASFLCDAVGNSHRAEINIEKLWNPYLPGRGRLGLVEFRGLRMQHTPQRATAIACLLRAVIAMLATRPYALPLIDWGRELHDRLPCRSTCRPIWTPCSRSWTRPGSAWRRPSRPCCATTRSAFWARWTCPLARWSCGAAWSSGRSWATPPAPSKAEAPASSTPARRESKSAGGRRQPAQRARWIPATGRTGRSPWTASPCRCAPNATAGAISRSSACAMPALPPAPACIPCWAARPR
jgi:uncharacterized protein (DUF2126 family)